MITLQRLTHAALLLAPFALGGCGGCFKPGMVCDGLVWYPEAECWTFGEHPPVPFSGLLEIDMTTVDDQGYCWIVDSMERPDWGPPGATLEEACPAEGREAGLTCLEILGYSPEI